MTTVDETSTRTPVKRTNSPEQRTSEVRRVTAWGLVLNLVLSALKFVIGVLGSSQALVADAVHSLSDSSTDVAVLIGTRYWSAPADERHPYGHGRIETVVTVFIGVVLFAIAIGLAFNALTALRTPRTTRPEWVVFAAACLSIAVKEAMYRWTLKVGQRVHSPAVTANAWHHRSDAFSSIPVAIAVLGTRLVPTWTFLDPVAALVVSALIMQASWSIAHPALNQLIDEGASQRIQIRLRDIVLDTSGIRDVHALRTRHIGNGLQVDLHLLVDPGITVREGHDLAGLVKHRLLQEGPDVVDVLIHVEPYAENTSNTT